MNELAAMYDFRHKFTKQEHILQSELEGHGLDFYSDKVFHNLIEVKNIAIGFIIQTVINDEIKKI